MFPKPNSYWAAEPGFEPSHDKIQQIFICHYQTASQSGDFWAHSRVRVRKEKGAPFMKSTRIVWGTTRCLALHGVQEWTGQGEARSYERPEHPWPASGVISLCWASASSSGKWEEPDCTRLSSSHSLWFHKNHVFSSLFQIQSGHKLWGMLLAAPKINYFHPFPLVRPFLQHDSQSIKSQDSRGTQQKNSNHGFPGVLPSTWSEEINTHGPRCPSPGSPQHKLRQKPAWLLHFVAEIFVSKLL